MDSAEIERWDDKCAGFRRTRSRSRRVRRLSLAGAMTTTWKAIYGCSRGDLSLLPAASCTHPSNRITVSVFAFGALVPSPSPPRGRSGALDRLAHPSPELGLPRRCSRLCGSSRWSGRIRASRRHFHGRFDGCPGRRIRVLAFLVAFQHAHGANFPFDEIETAVHRHWGRYQDS